MSIRTYHLNGVERQNFIAYGNHPSFEKKTDLVELVDDGNSLMLVYRDDSVRQEDMQSDFEFQIKSIFKFMKSHWPEIYNIYSKLPRPLSIERLFRALEEMQSDILEFKK